MQLPALRPFIAALGFSLLAACGGGSQEPALEEPVHVKLEGLGYVPEGQYVFGSQAEWQAFWAEHPHFDSTSRRPAPDVDFSRYALAGVFKGSKPRCRDLAVTNAATEGATIILRYRVVTFGQNTPSSCIGGDTFHVNLADVVLIPRGFSEVRFEQTDG